MRRPGGPYFDDLKVGDRFDDAPSVTLNSGLAAVHHSIVGGRLRLVFDTHLSEAVTGQGGAFASPALVWDVAIGQSTLVTERAIANLFYRDLAFLRTPAIGDSVRTVTTIIGLRPLAPKPGRPPRGLVVMRIETRDQLDRPVLDFYRCAMLPAQAQGEGGPQGKTDLPATAFTPEQLERPVNSWKLEPLGAAGGTGLFFSDLAAGAVPEIAGGDVVSNAPELARLTLNLAQVHHDRTAQPSGERLVYGGHTVGIALAQLTRALPALATVVAWHDCDHLGPVHEGDSLHGQLAVERCDARAGGGGFVHLRLRMSATALNDTRTDVLDWRLVGLLP